MAVEKDVVLIYLEGKPLAFARIEKIAPDIKKDWYHVTLLLLQLPLQTVTWILRSAYIDGTEFTMGGKPMKLAPVISPSEPTDPESEPRKSSRSNETAAEIISMADLKKRN